MTRLRDRPIMWERKVIFLQWVNVFSKEMTEFSEVGDDHRLDANSILLE